MRDQRILLSSILCALVGAAGCSSSEEPVRAGLDACKTIEPDCETVCVKTGFGECETDPCLKYGDTTTECPTDPCLKNGDTWECPPPDSCPKNGDTNETEECRDESGCTLTQGYWKNHPEAWPIDGLTIDGFTYSNEDLLLLLWLEPRGGNAALILAHQYIAAVLNAAADASTYAIDATALTALDWLELNTEGLPGYVAASSEAGKAATALADTLASFNEGEIGPGHCGGEEEYEVE